MYAAAASARAAKRSLPAAIAAAGLLGFLLAVAALTVGLTSTATVCGATPAAGEQAPGDAHAVPAAFLPYFVGAAVRFGLGSAGWAYLAAINAVESDFDDVSLPGVASGTNRFGAAGPMQIGVGGDASDTWARVEVTDVPGGATPPSVYDEADAVYAAANLLRGAGAPSDWTGAVFAYNHAGWYVREVGALAGRYEALGGVGAVGDCSAVLAAEPVVAGPAPALLPDGQAAIPEGAPAAVRAMLAAGNLIVDQRYSYAGGHSPASMGIPPDPAADPGEEENGGPGYDCSSAVDYVLWGAGLGRSLLGGAVPASEQLAALGEAGAGRWVTVYAGSSGGQAHAFIAVDGLVLDTVHLEPTTPTGTGPRWQPPAEVARELAAGAFVARHPPGL